MTAPFRILFIDFNSYFASVEQQLQPRLRGQPVAVVPVMTNSTCAIAASYEAKAYGVTTGTNIGEARRLCPGLQCVPARHGAYVDFHHRLRQEIDRHIPILRVESIDEMACELFGRFREESAARELAGQIKAGIRERVGACLTSSIGISTNRFLAKVASDLKKPDGVTVLHPDELPGRLAQRSLRDLPGIGKSMEARLRAKGVHRIDQLWHCAPKEAWGLWGSVVGERFWRALHGEWLEEPESERRMITHSHVLGPAERSIDRAEAVARRLLLKAASRLRASQRRASRMDLSVRVENGPRLEAGVRFDPVRDSFTLVRHLAGLWGGLRAEAGAVRFKKVALALHGLTVDSAPEQLSLFPEEAAMRSERTRGRRQAFEALSEAMDRVTRRYGRHALSLGLTAREGRGFTGTKIAFTRIPEVMDFDPDEGEGGDCMVGEPR